MKRMNLLTLLAFVVAVSFAAKEKKAPCWMDPNVNRINVMESRASFFAYENPELAQKMKKESSARFMTLEGAWKFFWVKNHDNAPENFFSLGYDDSKWVDFPVPGLFEINGYGDRIYKNVGYSWATQFQPDPPYIEEKNNYTGSYRRTFDVPAAWKGRKIFMHIGSATSNVTLWVNGKYVGYSEDSKGETEFDLTKYLVPGKKNLFAMQVMRWCDGTYLEDQDFWRFTGIAREVFLYATPKARVTDVFLTPDLVNNYQDGTLAVKLNAENANGKSVKLMLKDKNGAEVAQAEAKVSGGKAAYLFQLKNPQKWTAETPYFYTLYVSLASGDNDSEWIPQRVGFRKVEVKGGQLLVNGKAVYIKGADRHELDPKLGYVMPMSRMVQDIQVMKRMNINAIRTCHYQDDPRWYDLCDEYGIYLTAESNLESHGMGYGDKTLAKNLSFQKAHIERQEHNVYVNKNHPSVIVWSLGNEAGNGINFAKAYDFVKAYDPSRPVQYERACYPDRQEDYKNGWKMTKTDIYCPMYLDPAGCENYSKLNLPQPLIQCEYAHAMGNSVGNFKEYWDLVRKYPNYQGGYIWDFVDQGLSDVNKEGKPIYTYGGDYGRYPASDNNFNCNGLINPDRMMNPHAYEVAYYYQNVWTSPVDLKNGKIKVFNENFFRTLDYVSLQWTLLCDGKEAGKGVLDNISVPAQQYVDYTLPGFSLPDNVEGKELLLNVKYVLKQDEPLMKKGERIAYQQLPLRGYTYPVESALSAATPVPSSTSVTKKNAKQEQVPAVQKQEQLACLTLTAGRLAVTFNKYTGWIDYLDVDGRSMLEKGYPLQPDFWRAPTDNDMGAGIQRALRAWLNPEKKITSFKCTPNGSSVVVKATYELPAVAAKLFMTYTVTPQGVLLVDEQLTVDTEAKNKPALPRFGMQLVMPEPYSHISYYGRGPVENYCDRNNNTSLGIYDEKVENQYWNYIRPQESGNKTGIRWWKMSDSTGSGLEFFGFKPMECSALHFLTEDLDDGLEKHQRHSGELTPRDFSVVHISDRQMGVGGINSWGTWPLSEYMIPYGNQNFSFAIRPL